MRIWPSLLAGSLAMLLTGTPLLAQKKNRTAAPKVYEWNEVTPCSFDEMTAIELIQSRAKYPAAILEKGRRGDVHVEFIVEATGKTRDAKLRQDAYAYYEPADPAVSAAVLAAIKALPRLQPALREGKPVAVRLQLAVRYPNPPPSKMYSAGPNRVYVFAEQMPELPGGGGGAAIMAAIQKNLKYSSDQPALPATIANRVFVSFLIGADGIVRDAKVDKGLGAAYDEAALTAVRQLPAFVPGRQNGCPVAVKYAIPVIFAPR